MQSVRALLEEGVDVNVSRADGATALLWATHWDALSTSYSLPAPTSMPLTTTA